MCKVLNHDEEIGQAIVEQIRAERTRPTSLYLRLAQARCDGATPQELVAIREETLEW